MAKLKVDLHTIFNSGTLIDDAIYKALMKAKENKIPIVEIIHGKGSGQLKKRVIRYLNRKEIKQLYKRIEKDRNNFGRLFVRL